LLIGGSSSGKGIHPRKRQEKTPKISHGRSLHYMEKTALVAMIGGRFYEAFLLPFAAIADSIGSALTAPLH
jgi:hypothetical protein